MTTITTAAGATSVAVQYGRTITGCEVASWSSPDAAHQLVWVGSSVLFGTSSDGRTWTTFTVVEPSRFGDLPDPADVGPRAARAAWQAWVTAFVAP